MITNEECNPFTTEGYAGPYDEHNVMFVEPCFLIDLKTKACLTFRLSLKNLVLSIPNSGKALMTLVNRARNKPQLLSYLKELLTTSKLSLLDASRLFMRLSGVYK